MAINVHEDGTFDVTEQQAINFERGSFGSGNRDIPKRNLGYIDSWSLTDGSGNEYSLSSSGQPYTFSVEDYGTYYQIDWHFPRTESFRETFNLSYTVHDGLRFYEGGDQLWWTAIFGDRQSFPVLAGEVRVTVPERAAVQEWAAYVNERDASGCRDGGGAGERGDGRLCAKRAAALGRGVRGARRVYAGCGSGVCQLRGQQRADAEVAELEEASAFRNRWGPVASLAMLATGAGDFALAAPRCSTCSGIRAGATSPPKWSPTIYRSRRAICRPGLAGTLLDETVDMEDILATLVDLAERKAISITEDKEQGFFRNSTDFIYRRERDDVELLDYEDKLLDELFGRKQEVRLSELKDKFYDKLPGIRRSMYRATVDQGLFPQRSGRLCARATSRWALVSSLCRWC